MGFRSFLRNLRSDKSGNAALIVALGMPALIGGTGYAVDTAQWYTWKQELQFATDQAAIAGAYAQSKEITQQDYATRAEQEFEANLAITADIASEPDISLASYNGGTDNSVIVRASATATLPFSSFLTGKGTTVSVFSQARFQQGASYTSCVIATDDDDDGAITIRGNATLTAGCGMAALSNSDQAIIVDGNPQVDAGYIMSAGGIDDALTSLGDNQLLEYVEGLEDPYDDLTPPDNPTPREYKCQNNRGSKFASLQPGTYSDLTIQCDTILAGGIYVIEGGSLDINAQDDLTGNGVMFVLKDGANIKINGGSSVNLTAMTIGELIAAGVSAEDAEKLAGMLIFEDPNGDEASKDHVINGNASTVLNGIVYLPKSHVRFNGTASVTSQCFMLAASTIDIGGTADMTSFCPPDEVIDETVLTTKSLVRLVA
ncbi:Putative Flp pilus-assembly TadE/G-like [Altererythrobacter xiamenensis]|uniref:Putative Flp pilus-assembly TadE/G-like n=1 Tax=Altererythrobacter xiamenensis TaxID=1316679 RepID=A0A1Y6FM47_9SPHN|nr:TadE/TadG family type IV pilus assembly protein [Altererythrobacter xiamenensis]SMQ74561.1 Putative Flp pilus-assembly TadE/G-like [Altererythrobacter xiamenensis]